MCVVWPTRRAASAQGGVAEAWWLGAAERLEQVALVGGELGALGELAVG